MISKQRLAEDFAQLAKYSDPGEGVNRIAFGDANWQARDYIIRRMEEAGLSVRSDAFGNLYGRKEGSDPNAPAVLFGSHIDSVPSGGNFDGVVGVLSGIEVLRHLREENIVTAHPLELVVFMSEESSRFGVATLGSKAACGHLTTDELHARRDKEGKSLYDILKARGLRPDDIASARLTRPIKAFLEVHIEQGRVLEDSQKQIGVVTGIAASTRLKARLAGQADHSGATPMHMRRDGLCAAAEIILAVERLAAAAKEYPVVGTVGIIHAAPGVMNVIPGRVELGIDIRSISAETKDAVIEALRGEIAAISKRRGVPVEIEMLPNEKPVLIGEKMRGFLSGVCEASGHSYMHLPSGAGHDAMHIAEIAPTGMLFIPCKGGVSHNPAEYAELDDIVAVTEILSSAVQKLAQQTLRLD